MSKKIVIVTVYNSENCGSFLQAYAMQTVIKKMGFQVAFYCRDTAGTSHSFFRHLLSALKSALRLKYNDVKFIFKSWFAFEKASKIFTICDKTSNYYQDAEIVILGSDTIWNFDSLYFRNKANVYLGNTFNNKYVVSFAASAANTSSETFHDVILQNGGLDNISQFFVRDEHTKQLVENETTRTVEIVTDPTLLLDKMDYLKLVSDEKIGYRYVLLYYFGEPAEELKRKIQNYAKNKNLKIVSLLKYRKWCDVNISADPRKMVLFFNNADAVVTNTFHGCAFSIIFEKTFAVHNEEKMKVNDLLIKYGEEKRLFTESSQMLDLLQHTSSVAKNGKFDSIRNHSLNMLQKALEK